MTVDYKQKGFTIVELLIVIVVIGILAAITIVAYSGVQNRAKTSSGLSLTSSILKKAELYKTITSEYITSPAQFDSYPETKLSDPNSLYVSCTAWTSVTVATTPVASGSLGAGAADGRRVRVCGNASGGYGYYWNYLTNSEVPVKYGI